MERDAWWREQNSYPVLLDIFKEAHINNGGHLAYILLTQLERRGFAIVNESDIDGG